MVYLLLIVGFVLLIKGADFFVEGSSNIAKLLKIPSVVIGLTIVAIGTSLPEASVSINASLSGSNAIAFSNVVGSNIFNLLVVIGACAIMKPITTDKDIAKRDLPLNVGITILLAILMIDLNLSRTEGIILLVLLAGYLIALVKDALKNRTPESADDKPISAVKSLIFIVVGVAAIIWGGSLVVSSASEIAAMFGLSETLIGLTIVAVGTSLPELVTSIVATRKGESDLALGNAVGSCIFNILFILGMSAAVSPLSGSMEGLMDSLVLLGVTILVMIFARSKRNTGRIEGVISVAAYFAYMAYAIIR